jgi:hypothetical protein
VRQLNIRPLCGRRKADVSLHLVEDGYLVSKLKKLGAVVAHNAIMGTAKMFSRYLATVTVHGRFVLFARAINLALKYGHGHKQTIPRFLFRSFIRFDGWWLRTGRIWRRF